MGRISSYFVTLSSCPRHVGQEPTNPGTLIYITLHYTIYKYKCAWVGCGVCTILVPTKQQ